MEDSIKTYRVWVIRLAIRGHVCHSYQWNDVFKIKIQEIRYKVRNCMYVIQHRVYK